MDLRNHPDPLANFQINLPPNLRPLHLTQADLLAASQHESHHDAQRLDPSKQLNPVDLSAMKDKITRIMKLENLADITLAGYMIKLMRYKNKMSFKELHDEVSKCYDTLRRSDGSKYTGDLAKALKGCLTSSEIFKEAGDNVWAIREKEAKLYEEKTTKKLKTLINKKKGRSGRKKEGQEGEAGSDDDLSDSEGGGGGSDDDSVDPEKTLSAKKVKQSAIEYHKVSNLLDGAKKSRASQSSVQNILESLGAGETSEEFVTRIGNDRFQGMIDCYEYFFPLIQEQLAKQDGLGGLTLPGGKGEAGQKASKSKK